jgi:hypothetical protein
MSLGGILNSPALRRAINRATNKGNKFKVTVLIVGIIVIAAAGNYIPLAGKTWSGKT